jgi:hypothetical protein
MDRDLVDVGQVVDGIRQAGQARTGGGHGGPPLQVGAGDDETQKSKVPAVSKERRRETQAQLANERTYLA